MKALFLASDRPKSLYIAGNPGSGKSSLIQKMALKDIHAGRGVCVIDPTGDLVNRLIHWMPKIRVQKNEIIYFDTDNPVPIDFFSYRNPAERQVLTDQLLDVFKLENAPVSRPRLLKILGTLFDANENPRMKDDDRCTFLDIEHFIIDERRRNKILSYCPERRPQWEPFPKLADFLSITERMAPFTEPGTLHTMFAAKRPKLNIWDIMEKNLVFLVNLKDTPSDLFIGSLIASKFQQAVFGRRYIPESNRTPYYLYIDECHTILDYAVNDFEKILTRARKYKLCLTLANQIPEDLPDPIQRKLGTIGTLVLFNLDTNNARLFKDRIIPFEIQDLVGLPQFHAICRNGNQVYRIKTPLFLGPSPASYAKYIRKRTVDNYACNTPQVFHTEGDDKPEPESEKPPAKQAKKRNPKSSR